jgi:hypothetical protein
MMMKNIIFSVAIMAATYCTATQNRVELNNEKIIITKVIDMVSKKNLRPKKVFISEQLLSDLDRYLITHEGEKNTDSLALLIQGRWNYLKEKKSKPYSTAWKQVSLSKTEGGKTNSENEGKDDNILLSTVQFSPDGTKAFVVYNKTYKNNSQATVFFFFEKKNETWIHTAHFIPFFD